MSFIVFTANLQHGEGTDAVTDYSRQLTTLTTGDLIGVQERTTGATGWDAGLTSAGMVQAVYRENDTSQNDGNAIWYKSSKVTVNQTYQWDLSEGASTVWSGNVNVDKSAVAAKVTVEGKTFYFVNTHLAWSAGADSNGSTYSAIRVAQIKELLRVVNNELVGTQGVLMVGDFNLGPDYPKNPEGLQIDLITAAGFTDLWTQGIAQSKATASWGDRDSANGADMPITSLTTRTHDTRRIDYCFWRGSGLTLNAIDVPDLRANCSGALTGSPQYCPDTDAAQRWGTADDFGVRPSDHNWIKLTMDINAGAVPPVKTSQFSWFPNVNVK
jgi:endonuclease/exonuclease/phosphatase family metal-dependent hydrolase